ncbi:aminopeptidase N-like isoform X3 [Diabrotica virgifera virgifera]|uniref:Aminopeptidase n=1 Tax=Diabrotica virgifera virgifera TaxID=50390 RepID=A0ABM5KA38_DIAVI|nr:aminopeptidase N-like isoform X3 [Diabrotica virgifera virgifera]
MVGYYNNQGVPTSADLENNSNQKKYTVNQNGKQGVVIPRSLCALMAIGALLLAILVGLIVFFLVPRDCHATKSPQALTHQPPQSASVLNINSRGSSSNNDDTKAETTIAPIVTKVEVEQRLPRSIEPTHYRLRILPHFQNSTSEGSVTMTLNVLEDTNEIIFNSRSILIDEHSVSIRSTKPDSSLLEIKEQLYYEKEKYKIVLKEHLRKNEEYQLDLNFNGKLSGHLQGFYRIKYYDEYHRQRLIASTQFSPVDARSAFPCFDEPSFKANFQITIGRPADMLSLSNMPLAQKTPFSTNNSELWSWDEYPETPKMSTYLVAFMVMDFIKGAGDDPRMTFWARPQIAGNSAYAAQIGPKILSFYENYFGIKFPLSKIDIVAVPEFGFSAMENWGLITFREDVLLYDQQSSTNEDKRTTATILAHELAHQWFGNLVTPVFWNDLWLKEGFSNFLVYSGVNYAEPKWMFAEEFMLSENLDAMSEDALQTSRPISFDNIQNTVQIRQLFDPITYRKGAAIVNMISNFLGEETFKTGLTNFLTKYSYKNADRNDLFASLTEEAHNRQILLPNETVKIIMDTWTERAGYPVIYAYADYEQNTLSLSQKRFLYRMRDEKSSYWVPLSFTTNVKPNYTDTFPKFWLKGEYETVQNVNLADIKWYLLNLNQTGYFIVNYDERNWMSLVEAIMEVPTSIRAQLISDSMDLARANIISYDIPLRMIAKMAIRDNNIMFVPTAIAFEKLKYLSDILSSTPAFGFFESFHQTIFKESYKKVALEDPFDDYRTRRIRTTVLNWSCRSSETRCAHLSKIQFRQWMVGAKRVEPNLQQIVYCTALREGGQIEWDFAYKKYIEITSPTEKSTLLDALGCTRHTWLLSRYVDKILNDPSIRIQDADRVFQSVANNKFGTQIAFDFLRTNWVALLKHHGDGFNVIAKMVKALGPQMNTEFQLSELIRFRDSIHSNSSSASEAIASTIETVRGNVEWMQKNYHQVEQWLRKNKNNFDTL